MTQFLPLLDGGLVNADAVAFIDAPDRDERCRLWMRPGCGNGQVLYVAAEVYDALSDAAPGTEEIIARFGPEPVDTPSDGTHPLD